MSSRCPIEEGQHWGRAYKLCCDAMTYIRPEWVEDIKNSYPKDPNDIKYLKVIHSNTNQNHQYTLEGGVIKYKNIIYVGEQNNVRQQIL